MLLCKEGREEWGKREIEIPQDLSTLEHWCEFRMSALKLYLWVHLSIKVWWHIPLSPSTLEAGRSL